MLCVLVHNFFDFTLHTTANALLFLILAALATQDSRVDQTSQRRGSRRRLTQSDSATPELGTGAEPRAITGSGVSQTNRHSGFIPWTSARDLHQAIDSMKKPVDNLR